MKKFKIGDIVQYYGNNSDFIKYNISSNIGEVIDIRKNCIIVKFCTNNDKLLAGICKEDFDKIMKL